MLFESICGVVLLVILFTIYFQFYLLFFKPSLDYSGAAQEIIKKWLSGQSTIDYEELRLKLKLIITKHQDRLWLNQDFNEGMKFRFLIAITHLACWHQLKLESCPPYFSLRIEYNIIIYSNLSHK